MALINTIREKSGVAVGLVAVGMLLFIVGGDLVGGNNRLFNRNDQVVGEVAGQKVELNDYNNRPRASQAAFIAQQQRQPDDQAWATCATKPGTRPSTAWLSSRSGTN
jgi:peptidyl-prolyl cis-trans isomerase D